MINKRRIGIYGGSFDPIHFGHLNLAIELMENHRLDEVWFVPALLNPHKHDRPHLTLAHRKAMIELAIQEIPQFHLKDLEGHRQTPSYTVDTLTDLMEKEKNKQTNQYFLLLGEDSIQDFFQWKSPEVIVSLTPLLIGSRSIKENRLNLDGLDQSVVSAIKAGLTKTRIMDISSTELRNRLGKGLYCGHLVPAKVLEYIEAHRIYTS